MKQKNFILATLLSVIFLILFLSPGTKSSLKNEFLVILNKTSYPHEDLGVTTSLSNIIKDITSLNFYKNDRKKFEKIYINLKFEDLNILLDARKKSLALHKTNQYLIEKKRVPAEIIFKNKKFKSRIRLKGDRADHWIDNKLFSLDIKIKNGSIDGWERIALQSHSSRGFPRSLIISNMMKRLNIISENYKTYELIVNGQSWGKRYAIDRISESFFENRKLKESLTFKFTNQDNVFIASKVTSNDISVEDLEKILFSQGRYTTKFDNDVKIENFYLKSVIKTLNLRKFDQQNSHKKKLFIKDIFELNEIATIYAYIFLFNDGHPFGPGNLIFYFDPYLAKIRPIFNDATGSTSYNNFSSYKNFDFDYLNNFNNNLTYLLTDEIFFETIIKKMSLIINDFDNVRNDIKKIEKNYDKNFENVIPFKTITKNYQNFLKYKKNYFTKIKNISLAKNELDIKKLNQNYDNFVLKNKKFDQILIKNYKEKIFTRVYNDGWIEIQNLTNEQIKINKLIIQSSLNNCMQTIKVNLLVKPNDRVDNKIDTIKCSNAKYQIFATQEKKNLLSNGKVEDLETKHENLINKYNKNIYKNKDLIIKGSIIIDEPIKIKNSNLIIEEGSNILVNNNSFILIENGNLIINGTKKLPVNISSSDNYWGGIYVKNSKYSKIENLNIKNLDFFNDYKNLFFLTGAINFYKSNVEITNLNLSNSIAEDGINFINSYIKLKNINIDGVKSDGIDFDFSKGNIENISVSNVKGDGLDFSGSTFSINNSNFENILDKAISVGERSEININNIIVQNSNIAIAVKDGSLSNLRDFSFIDNNEDVTGYLKKPFYEIGGKINIYGNTKKLSTYTDEVSEIKFYD